MQTTRTDMPQCDLHATHVVLNVYFCYFLIAGRLQWGTGDKQGHSFILYTHTRTHTSLTGLSSLLSQASLVLSVSLQEKREMEGGCRRRRKTTTTTTSDLSSQFTAKPSTNLPHLSPSPLFGVTGCRSSLLLLNFYAVLPSPFHLSNPPSPTIPLISSSLCLAFIPPSLPLFLCPSLSLPGACLSGSVPVCLFADDSTWSRCDAQQLLLCSAALPPFISRSLCLSSSVSSVLIY